MKLAATFALAVLVMLAVVVIGDQVVGMAPATPEMSGSDRMGHLPLAAAAVGIVVAVDAAVIWLTFRHPPHDSGAEQRQEQK